MSHATQLLTLAVLADELLERVTATEDGVWSPSREAVEAVAARIHAPAPTRAPAQQARRRTVTRAAGLLEQVADLEVHAWARHDPSAGRTAPGPRPPAGAHAIEVAALVEAEILAAHSRLGGTGRVTPETALRGIVGLAAGLDLDDLDDLVRTVDGWVRHLRVELGWDVPVIAIRATCPLCGGVGTLRVRADASSDVWCAGRRIGPALPDLVTRWRGARLHGPARPGLLTAVVRCEARWPRTRWLSLLEHMEAS